MSLLDSLERRFGRFALPGLIRIVVALTALVYLLTFLNPDFLSVLTSTRREFFTAKFGASLPTSLSRARSVSPVR